MQLQHCQYVLQKPHPKFKESVWQLHRWYNHVLHDLPNMQECSRLCSRLSPPEPQGYLRGGPMYPQPVSV